MKLKILNNRNEIITETVQLLVDRITNNNKKTFVLGLSTGATVLSICQQLAQYVQNHNISLEHVVVFYAGEFIGYSQQKRHNYFNLLWSDFFEKIDICSENIHTLDGTVEDLDKECTQFEEKINEVGGIDLFIGSLGTTGGLSFNEPGSSLVSTTRLKTLSDATLQADARFFDNDMSKVPTQALTIGLQTIANAKEVLIVVYGVNKAFAVKGTLEHSISEMYPASVLQLHPNSRFFIDKVATRSLSTFIKSEITSN